MSVNGRRLGNAHRSAASWSSASRVRARCAETQFSLRSYRSSAKLVEMGGATQADPDEFAQLRERYGLEMQPETVPELLERFGLRMGEPLSGGWGA